MEIKDLDSRVKCIAKSDKNVTFLYSVKFEQVL